MTKMRTVSAEDHRAALDAAIKVLQQWKKLKDLQAVEIHSHLGMDEEISNDPFKTFKPNGTYTLTVKINGGARGI